MKLAGQRAIITGAASGIGRATALLFAEEGAAIAVADVNEAGGAETVETIRTASGEAFFQQTDVRSEMDVEALVAVTRERLGGIEILVNNAGVGSTDTLAGTSMERWQRVLAVNMTGTFLCSKHVIPHLLAQGHGTIINMASVAGMRGLPQRAAYCAAKAGVIGLTKAAAIDHADDGLRINAICPGTVDSPWVQGLLGQAPDPEEARQQLKARQPQGRLGRPEEIAHAALYLASPEAAYVTGTCFVIDGGLTAG